MSMGEAVLEQTNDRIGMPWAVRIALGWFILLAIACCAPFVFWLCPLLLSGDVQEALWNLVPCVGLMALGGGFVWAIICGRRIWVTVPYLFIALQFVFIIFPSESWVGPECYIIWAAATFGPLVMLHLPSSNRWFATFPLQEKMRVGCMVLAVLPIVGCLWGAIDVAPRPYASREMHAQMTCGRNVFLLLTRNEHARQKGKNWIDPGSCSNSVEFVERLCAKFDGVEHLIHAGGQWSFAINVPSEVSDSFPVMMSANVDPAQLPREWDGVTDKDVHLELKRIDGSAPMDFDDKFMVVIRKGGAVQILKRKYAIRRHVLGDAPYRLGKDTCFLTPAGKRNSLAASGESENAQRCR